MVPENSSASRVRALTQRSIDHHGQGAGTMPPVGAASGGKVVLRTSADGPTAPPVPDGIWSNRWTILFFSVLSMVAVANFQYGWTLFVAPLQKQLGVEQALIQVTFTVFVLLE